MTSVVFRVFGDEAEKFCLVFCGLTSRVTHIIIPDSECVVYDLDERNAALVWETFAACSSTTAFRRRPPIGRVAIVDMVNNFAHQAMNHLSGLQRLIDSGLETEVSEVWVSGKEFFGPTERVFPELAHKIRHVDSRDISSRLSQSGLDAFKVGSNFITRSLFDRLMRLGNNSYDHTIAGTGRFPMIAVTIRSAGRQCLNLPEILEHVATGLLPKYPNLGVILDGWIFPESSIVACSSTITALSDEYLPRMREEAELCRVIAARLPPGVLVRNLVGKSIFESLAGLCGVSAYLAHVGTLQHKLGWFTNAKGIIHGPPAELARLEVAYYSSEVGESPVSILHDDVEELRVDTGRGEGFHNYEIRNSLNIIRVLDEILSRVV
jgi:hypothetical protein